MLERRVTSPWAMDPSELDDVREHHPGNGPPCLRLSQFGLIRHLYEDCHDVGRRPANNETMGGALWKIEDGPEVS